MKYEDLNTQTDFTLQNIHIQIEAVLFFLLFFLLPVSLLISGTYCVQFLSGMVEMAYEE